MDVEAAPAEFIAKWHERWPEWSVAEAFVPETQRTVASAWFALRHELTEAAWGFEDPRPGEAKLEWWSEELRGWARGRRRHPLGAVLQKQPVPWILLADSTPALLASRGAAADAGQAAIRLEPFAEGVAGIGATLFADTAHPPPPPPPRSVVYGLLAEQLLRQGEAAVPDSIRGEAGTNALRAWAASLLQRWAPPHHGSIPGRLQALLVRERLQACADGRSAPSAWSRWTLPLRCRRIARD